MTPESLRPRRPRGSRSAGHDRTRRTTDRGATLLQLEETYDEVRQLIEIGKKKGYLLYDEVNELLPADIATSDELDALFTAFGNVGIEVVDSEQTYRERTALDRRSEGSEDIELDLTPSAIDNTNDPVRMYLREMGTVPLLTREGEVKIAKRFERGKLSILKAISRTPTIATAEGWCPADPGARDLPRRRGDRRAGRSPYP